MLIGIMDLSLSNDKGHSKITGITSLPEFNIWATSDADGNVKIWDGEGSIIR